MKLLITLFSILVFGWAFGQELPPSEMEGKHPHKMDKTKMLERLTQTLSLTEAQVKEIQAINKNYEKEELELEAQMKVLMDKKKEIREAKKSEIDKILTPEQKAKLIEMRKEKKTQWKEKRKKPE